MKKSSGIKVLVCLLSVGLIVGCQTGGGKKDVEQIKARMDGFSKAMLAKDLEGILSFVSENFYNSEVGNKAALRTALKDVLTSDFTKDGKIDLGSMEVKFDKKDKNIATVYPIAASSTMGHATVGFKLKKEVVGAAPATKDEKAKKAPKGKMDWFIIEVTDIET